MTEAGPEDGEKISFDDALRKLLQAPAKQPPEDGERQEPQEKPTKKEPPK